jgi:hypothetical protein
VLLEWGEEAATAKLFKLIKDFSVPDTSRKAALDGILSLGEMAADEALQLYMWEPGVYVSPSRFTHVRIRDRIYRYFLECGPFVKIQCLPFAALVTPEHAKECNRLLGELAGQHFGLEAADMHPERYYITGPFMRWFLSNRPYIVYNSDSRVFVVNQKAKDQEQPVDIRSGQKLTSEERNQLNCELAKLGELLNSREKKSRISPLQSDIENRK